jgi:hypothetical protein
MNLWGATPLLAAALLGGSHCPHTAAAHHVIHSRAAPSPSAQNSGQWPTTPARTPTPTAAPRPTPEATTLPSVSPAAQNPALSQAGPHRWKTTVILSGNHPACRGSRQVAYSLKIPQSKALIRGQVTRTTVIPAPTSATGSACQVTVTFTVPRQVPATATLMIDHSAAPSAISLTVSREVGLLDYLWIPAIVGGATALLLLLISVLFVKVRDRDGRRLSYFDADFWNSASGSLTLSNNWATNITVVLTAAGTIVALFAAGNSPFPGVTLYRFAIVFIIAGGIVVAAPLVFRILYLQWNSLNPGAMAGATLILPMGIRGTVETQATVALPPGTTVALHSGKPTVLGTSTSVDLRRGSAVQLPGGRTINLAQGVAATIPAGGGATLPATTTVRLRRWTVRPTVRRRTVRRYDLDAPVDVTLPDGASVTLPDTTAVTLPDDGRATLPQVVQRAELRARTAVRLPDDRIGSVARGTSVVLPPAAAAALPAKTVRRPTGKIEVTLPADPTVTLPDGATASLTAAAAEAVGLDAEATMVTVPPGITVMLDPDTRVSLTQAGNDRAATIAVAYGASILLPGGATVRPDGGAAHSWQVEAGATILVPPGCSIMVPPGASMALLGTTPDIAVHGESTLTISADAGHLTIPEGYLTPAPGTPPGDANVSLPLYITVLGGAGITVAGVADITLPQDTLVKAPRRLPFKLDQKWDLQAPGSNGAIAASLLLVLIQAAVATFGIGAMIGIGFILAFSLSELSPTGRLVALGIAVLADISVLYCAAASIRHQFSAST